MPDKSTGDVTADEYHKYKEDVKLMSVMGLDAYRFSISWSRLIPNGRGAVNPKGLQYYNNLINELISNGIQPHVTIYHLDLPQIIEDKYGGWLSPRIVEDFSAYADVCFKKFGDRVTHWTTINEPNMLAIAGYDNGFIPPGRCSAGFGFNCTGGNSSVEPYIAAHHTLLAHASAAALYREKYQATQKGLIGMNFYGMWFMPFSDSKADVEATQRALDFNNGWWDPTPIGVWRLSGGDEEECRLKAPIFHQITVTTSQGFIFGMNSEFFADVEWNIQVGPTNLPVVPTGLQGLLEYMRDRYGNPPVYVHENGKNGFFNETLNDTARAEYIGEYINATLNAIRNGANAKGYFVWSFLDVFEFLGGHLLRYGLYHVDFEDENRTRRPKLSAHWFSKLLKEKKAERIRKMGQQHFMEMIGSI
ncbi:hypothetical protein ACLOJK_017839 [Asimina triloba]